MPPQFQPLRDAVKQMAKGHVVSASSTQTCLYPVERMSDCKENSEFLHTHYWHRDQGCFLLASVFPGNFFNFKQTLPPGAKAPGFRVGEK